MAKATRRLSGRSIPILFIGGGGINQQMSNIYI